MTPIEEAVPTLELQIIRKRRPPQGERQDVWEVNILQQKFIVNGVEEWRDVPKVDQ